MTDPRPSEHQDDYPKFPTLVAQFGQTFEAPTAKDPVDHKAEAEEILANRASQNDPNGLAIAHALLALVEQQRVANLIAWTTGYQPTPPVLAQIEKGLGL